MRIIKLLSVLFIVCLLSSCDVSKEPSTSTTANNLTDFKLQSNNKIDSSINLENYPNIGVTDFTISLSEKIFSYKFFCDERHIVSAHALYPKEVNDEGSLNQELENKVIDLAFIEKPANDTNFNDSLKYTQIGENAIVFFTSVSNTINSLSTDDILKIYKSKEIEDWKTLGGKTGDIVIPEKDKNDIAMLALKKFLNINEDQIYFNISTEDAVSLLPDSSLKGAYAAYSKAPNFVIDYALYSFYEFGQTSDSAYSSGVKKIKFNKKAISENTVLSGEYPYSIKIYAVTNKNSSNSSVSHIIDWLQNGQDCYETKLASGVGLY